MGNPPPAGIYVPVPTFFVKKSASNYDPVAPPLDLETQAQHAIHLAKSGIKGQVLLGSTGEAIHMTNAERTQVLSHIRKAVDDAGFKDYPIIAGTATQSIEDTVAQLRDAQSAGAQWGLCLAPGYFATAASQQGIIEWFKAVADRSPIPVLIYHYPAVSNNLALLPSTLVALSKHPNIVGCKLSHGALDDHTLVASSPEVDHDHFLVFSGLGQQLLPLLTVGGAGVIDGLAAVFPKTAVKLYDTFHSTINGSNKQSLPESLKEMQHLQYIICQGEKIVARWGTIGVKEACARIHGFGDPDGARMPLSGGFPDGDKEWAKWKPVMDELENTENALSLANGTSAK